MMVSAEIRLEILSLSPSFLFLPSPASILWLAKLEEREAGHDCASCKTQGSLWGSMLSPPSLSHPKGGSGD